MIMGRKTFVDTPPSVLQNTTNIVFTRDKTNACFRDPDMPCKVVSSLDELMPLIESVTDRKVFMIGGGEVARIFFKANLISEFVLTKIHQSFEGNCYLDLHFMDAWERQVLQSTEQYTIYRVINPNPGNTNSST